MNNATVAAAAAQSAFTQMQSQYSTLRRRALLRCSMRGRAPVRYAAPGAENP
jgi:hypothetical protein